MSGVRLAVPTHVEEARDQLQTRSASSSARCRRISTRCSRFLREGRRGGTTDQIRIDAEMVHMCLASNILNAIGGNRGLTPVLTISAVRAIHDPGRPGIRPKRVAGVAHSAAKT